MLRLVANGGGLQQLFALVVSVGAAIGVATLAYYLIERPAMRSSAAIRYARRPRRDERETVARPSLPIPIVSSTSQ